MLKCHVMLEGGEVGFMGEDILEHVASIAGDSSSLNLDFDKMWI